MKPFRSVLFLLAFLLVQLGSRAAPTASPSSGSDPAGVGRPSQTSPLAPEAASGDGPEPSQTPGEPSQTPGAASPEPSALGSTETPAPDLGETLFSEAPETPSRDPLTASTPESPGTPDPSETPKPDPAEIPHSASPVASTTLTQTTHPEPPETPKPNATEISRVEAPETPNPDPTKTLDPTSPETRDPDTTEAADQTLQPDPTETPNPEPHVTHNPGPTELPTAHSRNASETPVTCDPEIPTTPPPDTPATFKEEATALGEAHLSPTPDTPAATQPDSPKLPPSESPGAVELKAPQNSSSKGPDTPPPSARIASPPAPPGPPNQLAPATLRDPPRRSRGDSVNTIIVVERVKETGVTLVGRPRGAGGGALCLFFAGTGLLIGIFLLLWCLYRRAARHRPFAHHRLPDHGDEAVMHLDTPKDPYDLYFYAPDAWVPSHIATKQPPPTPPLPPKLPPPPRGGRPQRLEALSPATLPDNFV